MRPNDNGILWKCFLKGRDEPLEILEDGLLVITQSFGIITTHTLGSPAEGGLIPEFPNRSEEIQVWRKGIDVIKVRINENEITIGPAELIGFTLVKSVDFVSQQITTRIPGDMNRRPGRELGILPPQLGVLFTPSKEMGHIPYPLGTDSTPIISLRLRVDQSFFIPGHDFMAKLAHNLKYDVSMDRHALGKIYAPGKRSYMNVHLTAGPDE
jgi:hypothetical protein